MLWAVSKLNFTQLKVYVALNLIQTYGCLHYGQLRWTSRFAMHIDIIYARAFVYQKIYSYFIMRTYKQFCASVIVSTFILIYWVFRVGYPADLRHIRFSYLLPTFWTSIWTQSLQIWGRSIKTRNLAPVC